MHRRTLLLGLLSAPLITSCGDDEAPPVQARPPRPVDARAQPPLPPGATLHRSAHYHITSATTPEATAQGADALEAVRGMFLALFGVAAPEVAKPLRVVLYRNRTQFKAHNRSHGWAEAYYLPPVCHAWLDDEPNRFHWLTHEATHQLARELAGFPRKRWLDEGIASYVGAADPHGGTFRIGSADRHAYPAWWLHRHDWHGTLQADREAGHWTPLADLMDDRVAPGRGGDVNRVYVQYWVLAHFLLHHARESLRPALHVLLREGGGSAAFERHVGPLSEVEPAVHAYLMARVDAARRAG